MNKMKRLLLFIAMVMCIGAVGAQQHQRGPRGHMPPSFDPARFEAELEQFIVEEACLTPKEASVFFPLYREMRKKQMVYFNKMRRDRFADYADDKACERIIREADQRDLDLKKLQQQYHNKFMKVLSPSKTCRVIRAEEKFHRKIFKRAAKRDGEV